MRRFQLKNGRDPAEQQNEGDMRDNRNVGASWSAVRVPAWTASGIAAAILAGMPKSLLFAGALACALAASWTADAGSSYLAVWSSDKETDDNRLNTDFLAIIDADPNSETYGKVVNTASPAEVVARPRHGIENSEDRSTNLFVMRKAE
jgi:hypothetical protein